MLPKMSHIGVGTDTTPPIPSPYPADVLCFNPLDPIGVRLGDMDLVRLAYEYRGSSDPALLTAIVRELERRQELCRQIAP